MSSHLSVGLFLAAFALTSSAATHTVGSEKEFATPALINWAVIQPGDTITIYPGTYPAAGGGNSLVIASVNGTSTKKSPSTPRLAQDLYSLTESTLPSRNTSSSVGLK